MRTRELRELSDEELQRRLADSREELFNLRFQAATGALENTSRLNYAKRDIARILTIQVQRERDADPLTRPLSPRGRR
jgi:large subunit ribosomal protein L29